MPRRAPLAARAPSGRTAQGVPEGWTRGRRAARRFGLRPENLPAPKTPGLPDAITRRPLLPLTPAPDGGLQGEFPRNSQASLSRSRGPGGFGPGNSQPLESCLASCRSPDANRSHHLAHPPISGLVPLPRPRDGFPSHGRGCLWPRVGGNPFPGPLHLNPGGGAVGSACHPARPCRQTGPRLHGGGNERIGDVPDVFDERL